MMPSSNVWTMMRWGTSPTTDSLMCALPTAPVSWHSVVAAQSVISSCTGGTMIENVVATVVWKSAPTPAVTCMSIDGPSGVMNVATK
jgi:hypothetical protein